MSTEQTYTGGKFRKKRINFSMISNEILRNEKISLKAKGLYSLIQSYITMDDFILYKGFLMSKCPEGRRSFDSAWNQLKQSGYLVQYRMKDEKNHFYYEYELLDVPVHQNVTPEKTGTSVVSVCDSSDCVVHKVDDTQNDAIYKTLQNKTLQKNTNQIISFDDTMRQIGYSKESLTDEVENIITLMTEVYNMADSSLIRINQQNVSAEVVKERFKKIRYEHIDYILVVLNDFTGSIRNIRNFMLTTIFNSVSVSSIYFSQRVQHDMYGEEEQQWKAAK